MHLQCDNIEKVNYELTDRIRIVTCQPFFTFPIWITQDVIIVRVGKSSLPHLDNHKTTSTSQFIVWSIVYGQVCILALNLAA